METKLRSIIKERKERIQIDSLSQNDFQQRKGYIKGLEDALIMFIGWNRRRKNPQEMVLEYHQKMGFTINDSPTPISHEQVEDRSDILEEEVRELREALEREDIIKTADGIGDVLYVAYGTGVACGIDVLPIFIEIHRSNMTKIAPQSRTGKAIKGEYYSPPDIESIILAQQGGITG